MVVVLEGGRVKECGPPEVVLPHLPQQDSDKEEDEAPKSEGKEEESEKSSKKVKEASLVLWLGLSHCRSTVLSSAV